MAFFEEQKSRKNQDPQEEDNFNTRKTNTLMKSYNSATVQISFDHVNNSYKVEDNGVVDLYPASSPVTFSKNNGLLYVGTIALSKPVSNGSVVITPPSALNMIQTTVLWNDTDDFLVIGEIDILSKQLVGEPTTVFIGVGQRRGDLGATLSKNSGKIKIDHGVIKAGEIS